MAALSSAASAASISVTTGADTVGDDGVCSLREAVQAANTNVAAASAGGGCPAGTGPAGITRPAGTYPLSRAGFDDTNSAGDLDVTTPLTLQGAGARSTTIDAAGTDRVLDVIGAATAVDVKQLTL